MDFSQLTGQIVAFAVRYKLLAAVIVLGILYYALAKTKEFFKFLAVLVVLAVAIYFLTLFGGTLTTGVDSKDRVIHKTRKVLDE